MSDTSATFIKIGGTLPLDHAREFIELIAGQLGADWGDVLDEAEAIQLVESPHDRPLCLYDNEAPYGQFQDLEDFCREHALSYVRGDDGHYSYAAAVVMWKPGMDERKQWTSAMDMGAFLSAKQIRARLADRTLLAELLLMEEADDFQVPFVGCKVPEAEAEPEVDQPLYQHPVDQLIDAVLSARQGFVDFAHLRQLAQAVLDQYKEDGKEPADGE